MTTTSPGPVQTGAAERRKLRFETAEQAIGEAERIAEAERTGKAQYAGNWDAGQILNHLGAWAEFAYGGNPIKPMWIMWLVSRLIAKRMLRRFLVEGLPAGHKIPGVAGGTVANERMPADQGLARMRAAFARLKSEPPSGRHPFFGAMTHEQWIALNLRHAELHMSFVKV